MNEACLIVRSHRITMNLPKIFKIGLASLWIAICLQVLSAFILRSTLFLGSGLFSNILFSLPYLLLAFLAYKTSVGKNWARISFLIVFLVLILPNGLITSIPFVLGLANGQLMSINWHYQFASALIATALLLQTFALYIFFSKPSALCFRQSK